MAPKLTEVAKVRIGLDILPIGLQKIIKKNPARAVTLLHLRAQVGIHCKVLDNNGITLSQPRSLLAPTYRTPDSCVQASNCEKHG